MSREVDRFNMFLKEKETRYHDIMDRNVSVSARMTFVKIITHFLPSTCTTPASRLFEFMEGAKACSDDFQGCRF